MNKKNLIRIFFHLMLLNSFFGKCFASTAERLEKISQELMAVKEYLSTISEPKLVLGVDSNEGNLGRFSSDYIFLDIVQNSTNNRGLSVNFNDLDELKLLASALKDVFSMIVLDDSTYKSTDWSHKHIAYFKEMLRLEGLFIFGPSLCSTGFSFDDSVSYEESLQGLKKWLSSQNTLVHSFELPFFLTAGSKDFSLKIQQQFDIYKTFQATPQTGWDDLMTQLGIMWMPSDYFLDKSDEEIKNHVAGEIMRQELSRDFYDNAILPNNTIRIMREIFGEEVLLEYNKPLPFTTNFNLSQKYLITATKKS